MSNSTYNLSCLEMLERMFSKGGWYQGEAFADGVYITLEKEYGEVRVYGFVKDKLGKQNFGNFQLTTGSYSQKYREVWTQPEIERRV